MRCNVKKWQRVELMGKEEAGIKEMEVADLSRSTTAQLLASPQSAPPPLGPSGISLEGL